ncbi:MAG: APC family permease [Pseudonocardia sp.]|nr:APC family permease [Pseudonocardia sp.]
MFPVLKRLLVGRPLRSARLGETLLSKRVALAVFCSDPISSVAYATEQIVLVLAAGGLVALRSSPWVGLVVALLLVTVVASYRQTCFAYPSGGGAYVVSRENLGETAALAAAAALLVDYVMTVAVSVTSGVVAVTSAFPLLSPYAMAIGIGMILVLALANLRGTKESGRAFAVPTYVFVGLTLLMFVWAGVKAVTVGLPPASTASMPMPPSTGLAGAALALLLVRAFASGCTALTGVEAISNGVPSFQKPKARNAAATLTMMGIIAVLLFGGITVLAIALDARALPDGDPSVISQIAVSVFGGSSALFYLFQAATAAILILAANTAFNGFPGLASILARDRYLPRQLHNRGDRLVFSNGVLLLAAAAIALIIGFDANLDRLIQLYIIGVFTSFTLSQFGMVRHWQRALRDGTQTPPTAARGVRAGLGAPERRAIRRSQAINAVGAVFTAVVLVVVFATKVAHGAWIAVIAMVLLFIAMRATNRYYRRVTAEVSPHPDDPPVTLPSRVHALVLISRLHKPALRALALARAIRPDQITALTLNVEDDETRQLRREWEDNVIPVRLTVLEAPYRDPHRPLITYVKKLRATHPQTVIMVFIPEYVLTKWWQQILHNQSALRFKARLLFTPGVVVVDVPYHLGGGDQGWLGTRKEHKTPVGPVTGITGDGADLTDLTPAS